MKRIWIAIAALAASSAGAAYKCVDAKGITHIGDTPPPGCASVMMYEVTATGKVVRAIEPTLTPDQVKVRQAELERKKEADKIAAEQKRKDMALLSTFSSEKEFDAARDRNIEPIKVRISSVQDRIKAVEKRQKEIEDEMEFYKAGKKSGKAREVPANLTSDLQRSQAEKSALVSTILGYEKEIEQIRVKFDGDKKRWLDLKAAPATAAPAAAKPGTTTPADTKTVKKN
jgi:hypothetical protein